MLIQILTHTPTWVFALFAGLLVLGVSQLAGRRIGWRRVALLPLAMLGLSLAGVVSAFAGRQPEVLAAWAAAVGLAAAVVASRPLPEGTRYDPAARRFAVPGSAWPLVLMMAIFSTKYAVGVALAMQPALAGQAAFAWGLSLLYGTLSGVFLGRALRLWRLALPTLGQAPALA
ncbi:MAG: DUF6622 family protein [Burkholderiaceae bacterium]